MSAPAAASSARRCGDPALPWTAIEPSRDHARAASAASSRRRACIATGWEAADVPARRPRHRAGRDHAAPSSIIPKPSSPRCLAGRGAPSSGSCRRMPDRAACASPAVCPREWHGEDETPGIDIVMRGLAPSSRPHHVAFADWTFSGVVTDLDRACRLSRRSPGLGRARPSPRRARAPSRPPGEARRAPAPPRHSGNPPFLFGEANEQSMPSKRGVGCSGRAAIGLAMSAVLVSGAARASQHRAQVYSAARSWSRLAEDPSPASA